MKNNLGNGGYQNPSSVWLAQPKIIAIVLAAIAQIGRTDNIDVDLLQGSDVDFSFRVERTVPGKFCTFSVANRRK